jgi:uncharacterized membrane protein
MMGQSQSYRRLTWDWGVVLFLVAGWTAVISYFAVQRYLAMRTEFDLAVYSHVIWTTTQGRPFFNSLVDGTTNYLSHHFTPLLLIYVPIYAAWADPRALLIAQTAILASSALPLYGFARRLIGVRLGLAVVVAYLASPLLPYVAFADFHEIAPALPLLMAAGAALLDRRARAAVIFLVLAMLAKEEIAIIALGFGLYAMLIQRRWRYGAAIALGSVLWGALVFRVLMPLFSGSLAGRDDFGFLWRYQALGGTPGEIVTTVITRPGEVARSLATPERGMYLWQLLAPLAFLPLLGQPAFLLALPPLAYLMLSNYAFQYSIYYHYATPVIPFVFLAAVTALGYLRGWGRRIAAMAAILMLGATLVAAWRWGPLPGEGGYRPAEYAVTDAARNARALMATIPRDASVAADSYLQPWLINRWRIGSLDWVPFSQFPGETPDYLATQEPGPDAVEAPLYPWLQRDASDDPLLIPRFEREEVTSGGVAVWRRRAGEDVPLARYDADFESGLKLVGAGLPPEVGNWDETLHAAPGETLPVWMAWQATLPLDRQITFSLHVVDEAGERVAQVDSEMAGGRFPTNLWNTWVDRPMLADAFPVTLPVDLPPGRYRLLGGAFETDTVRALSRPDGSQWIELAVIEVNP